MCTALHLQTETDSFFGRNMDIPCNFGQQPLEIARGYRWLNRATQKYTPVQYRILGMGTLIGSHPAMAEAMNEAGLACAGLNFPGHVHYARASQPGKENLPPYDFILWVLSRYGSIAELWDDLQRVCMVNVPLHEKIPVSSLHWMLSDRSGRSIVVEHTETGLHIYENPVGVMSNNPEFPWHLTNLRQYLALSARDKGVCCWSDLCLKPLGVGSGTLGLPGDACSPSRFVRAAFSRANLPQGRCPEECLSQFFHILDGVAMAKGTVITADGQEDYTLYTSCMDLKKGVYYYRSYENSRLTGIPFGKAAMGEIAAYPYRNTQDIAFEA